MLNETLTLFEGEEILVYNHCHFFKSLWDCKNLQYFFWVFLLSILVLLQKNFTDIKFMSKRLLTDLLLS